MLQEQSIHRAEINGYHTEEFTHLAVAAAIAGGVADAGIGIEAAAHRLKMDFITQCSQTESPVCFSEKWE